MTPRLAGRVSEPVRPKILDYTALLERDLGLEQDANDRLRLRIKGLKAELAAAQSRLVVLQGELGRRQGRRSNAEMVAVTRSHLPKKRLLWLGLLALDIPMRRITLAGRTASLTPNELGILSYLMARPDTIVDTSTLAIVIGANPNGNAVRTYMFRLRPKLAEIGAASYLRAHSRVFTGGGQWMTNADRVER